MGKYQLETISWFEEFLLQFVKEEDFLYEFPFIWCKVKKIFGKLYFIRFDFISEK